MLRKLALLSVISTVVFAGDLEVACAKDQLIHAMVQEEASCEEVLEAVRSAKEQGEDISDALGVALILWKEGEVRDSKVIIGAIQSQELAPDEQKLIELASKVYELRTLDASEEVSEGATPWNVVRRENLYKWAEEDAENWQGISPALEAELKSLLEQHKTQ